MELIYTTCNQCQLTFLIKVSFLNLMLWKIAICGFIDLYSWFLDSSLKLSKPLQCTLILEFHFQFEPGRFCPAEWIWWNSLAIQLEHITRPFTAHLILEHVIVPCSAYLYVGFSNRLPSQYHAPIPRVGLAIITPKNANPSQVRTWTTLYFVRNWFKSAFKSLILPSSFHS